MQGKLQSTLANTKTPALNLQPPQINKVDIKQIQASTGQLANTTKDWGVSAFKSLSSAAQRVSANVTQGIQKEHEEFIKQKKLETVVPHQGTGTLLCSHGRQPVSFFFLVLAANSSCHIAVLHIYRIFACMGWYAG